MSWKEKQNVKNAFLAVIVGLLSSGVAAMQLAINVDPIDWTRMLAGLTFLAVSIVMIWIRGLIFPDTKKD